MFLRELIIKNFRSLKDVSLILDKETILIGENNSGKTSVLDAIRFALSKISNRYQFDEYDYYMNQEISSPQESEGISIILRFEESVEGEWPEEVTNQLSEVLQDINGDNRYSIIIQTYSVFNKGTGDYDCKTVFLNYKYEELSKQQNKLTNFLKLIQVFYLQALRDIKDTFSSKSVFWGRFLKKASISKDDLVKIQEQIEDLNNSIISRDKNLFELVNSLKRIQEIMNFNGTNTVSINAMPLKSWDLLSRAQIVMNNDANGLALPLDRHGQGTQSITTILLFRAYIELLFNLSPNRGATAILTLEEPEAHLHPQAIRALAKSLSDISCQKVITTHSPYFIQNLNLKNIRFLSKKDGNTEIKQLKTKIVFKPDLIPEGFRQHVKYNSDNFLITDDDKVVIKKSIEESKEQVFISFFKDQSIDIFYYINESKNIFSENELNNLNTYVQKSRGDILFARKWLLYEGQSEDIIIPYFANLLGKNLDAYGVSTIVYRTNGSAKAFIKLAKVLDVDWYILADNDVQGENTKKEILSCGINKDELDKRFFITNEKDFEHELSLQSSIYQDYVSIGQTKNSKQKKDNIDIISSIQSNKVDSAYALISIWEERNFNIDEIPKLFVDLIERVCR